MMNAENIKRKYYEVWGDLEAQNNTLKLALLGLILVFAIFIFLSFLGSRKPPVVIRVNDIGSAQAVSDYPANNAITKPELFYFTKLFIEKFTAYNSYTLSSDLSEAFSLMTKRYQEVAKKDLIDSKLVSQISDASLRASVELRNIKIEREDAKFATLSFICLRTIRSYSNKDFLKESLFKGDMVLKKVNRSMTNPHGLLVDVYSEVLVKEID
jgi:hypothetical protein